MDNIPPVNNLIDLSGKIAIVTGGAKGIGFSISYRLAEARAKIVIADADEGAAVEAAEKLTKKGWMAKAVKTDVADEDSVKRMIEETVNVFAGLDILVNNAGIYPNMLVADMSVADFDKVLSVNLKGVFLCTKYAAEEMKKDGKGGKVINITSIDALHPSIVGLAHYDASKHGVWGFTKNIALELAQHKIWVNAIAPGGITTPGTIMPAGQETNKIMEAFLIKIPMHRLGEPDEIGRVALFLASDLSSYMTGSQIVVDGGVLLS